MNPSLLVDSPVLVMLFKWTGVLAAGWAVDFILRHRHPRWRAMLWRGVLCVGLTLPCMPFFKISGIKIPISVEAPATSVVAPASSAVVASTPVQPTAPQKASPAVVGSPAALNAIAPSMRPPAKPMPWGKVFEAIWAIGCVCAILRLMRLHLQLCRLRERAACPGPELDRLAKEIQLRLRVQQKVGVRISDFAGSPFVCGVFRPVIILPRKLAEKFSRPEMSALLSHEFAHLRRNDLFWCVAWQWMKAFCWFHPLVWQVPAAHNFACEEEADRCASRALPDEDNYPQLLARLVWQVLALPAVETELTLNGGSQIARRLNHLARKGMKAWDWRHSALGFSLCGMLFIVTAGCNFSKSVSTTSTSSAGGAFGNVLVTVQDENGKPIEGATIVPDGFRVKGIHGADAYHWGKQFGGPVKAITDRDGKAFVKYPVMGIPEEKELTGALIFSVLHPEFATVRIQEYSVDKSEQPIRLTNGIHLDVSGYFGSDHRPVTDLTANLTDGVSSDEWQKKEGEVLAFHKLAPGGHLLQLMGRLPSGEIVYSDTMAFTAEKGRPYRFLMEMKPGIRLEGRIDDQVPRPVRNGRVMIDVRPPQYPALDVVEDYYDPDKKYGSGRYFWHSYRPINEDGTFVFESVPPGEADIVVLGDGFASRTIGQLHNRINGVLTKAAVMAIPQAFPLVSPVTKVEVKTEPAATLEFTATTKSGRPIENVWVGTYPEVFRMWGPFGWPENSSEGPYRKIPHLPDLKFTGQTDKEGKLVLKNLPAEINGIEVEHPHFQVPLQDVNGWRDRHVRTRFSPGMTNELKLTLEPIGSDFIGQN